MALCVVVPCRAQRGPTQQKVLGSEAVVLAGTRHLLKFVHPQLVQQSGPGAVLVGIAEMEGCSSGEFLASWSWWAPNIRCGASQVAREEREQLHRQQGLAQLMSVLHAPAPGPSASGGPDSLAEPLRAAVLPSTGGGGAGNEEEDNEENSNSHGGLQGPMANIAPGV